MRRYLLDTTPLAAYLQGRAQAVSLITPWLRAREAATSILAYGEVVEYLKRLPTYPEQQRELRLLLREVYPYSLTYAILERFADIRLALRKGAGLIGDIDTLIAATALERRLTIVTADNDFTRVPELPVMLLDRATLAIAQQP